MFFFSSLNANERRSGPTITYNGMSQSTRVLKIYELHLQSYGSQMFLCIIGKMSFLSTFFPLTHISSLYGSHKVRLKSVCVCFSKIIISYLVVKYCFHVLNGGNREGGCLFLQIHIYEDIKSTGTPPPFIKAPSMIVFNFF